MKPIVRLIFFLLSLIYCFPSLGQTETYRYQRPISGQNGQWHSVNLPEDVFEKTKPDLSDIRIMGITTNKDTIEAPYLLRISSEKTTKRNVDFRTINESFAGDGYYVTFEVPSREPINQIELNFKQENFDWLSRLEGSADQQKWFTIADQYRIMAIRNPLTDFNFTTIGFPASSYRFFRLRIVSTEKPVLLKATVVLNEKTEGTYQRYSYESAPIREDKENRQTEIAVSFSHTVPVSRIKIGVKDEVDFYRPFNIQTVVDSFQTQSGWRHHYRTVSSGILSSATPNIFDFESTLVKKIRILIHNQNNHPLDAALDEISGFRHDLVVRFPQEADYFLVYGNKNATGPQYDLGHFSHKIPDSLTAVSLGKEILSGPVEKSKIPLFQNKIWLWGLMAIVMIVLGWFSIKMMRSS